jgi:hypothetical protein
MSDDISNVSGVTIASYAVPAFEAAYASQYSKPEIEAILTPAGRAATPSMAALCLLSETKQIHAIADPLVGKYVTSDPATTEPWKTMLRENSAGDGIIPVPIYVGQGLADTLVIPTATQQFVAGLCSSGSSVTFHRFPGISHALAAYASVPTLMPWFADVLGGKPPLSTC